MAVGALQRAHFYQAGGQYMLHIREKGGNSREIPVRHDLQEMIFAYLDAAGLRDAPWIRRCFRARCAKPELLATGPGQIWSWDITKLLGR